MTSDRLTETEIKCALLWRLVRSHGWANWLPDDELIKAVPTHERGRARQVVANLNRESYIRQHHNRGLKINNSQIDRLADELHTTCNYSKFRIEATLSHFGGFD